MPIAKHQVGPMFRELNKVIDCAKNSELPIIYVGNEFERTQVLSNFFRNQAAMKGSQGALLDERLHLANNVYFPKKVGNALTNLGLVDYLMENMTRHLVITGLFAEGCVSATTKGALKSGFKVTVLSDAVAGASDVKRDKTLYHLKSRGAHITTAQEFLNTL